MRISLVFFVLLLISACGMKQEKSDRNDKSLEKEQLVIEEYLQ